MSKKKQVDRIQSSSTEELLEELRINTAHIESLEDTNRKIENELFMRDNPECMHSQKEKP